MARTDQSRPVVICDAGPLIHLDELGCLDLLGGFSEVWVPEAVWREVERHRPGALVDPAVVLIRVQPTNPVPPVLEAMVQVLNLHQGEWEPLRVVLDHGSALLLTDDTAARLAAGNLGIAAHGTIGMLVRSIRLRHRTKEEVLAILRSLPERSTLHLRRSLLEKVISEVEESGPLSP
jgi:predicted nucleic acid-binding protein